jgi:hypothetical protein
MRWFLRRIESPDKYFLKAYKVKIVPLEHLKKVTVRIFTSDFIKASRKILLVFFAKRQLKIVKTKSAHSKSTVLIFRTFKKNFIS